MGIHHSASGMLRIRVLFWCLWRVYNYLVMFKLCAWWTDWSCFVFVSCCFTFGSDVQLLPSSQPSAHRLLLERGAGWVASFHRDRDACMYFCQLVHSSYDTLSATFSGNVTWSHPWLASIRSNLRTMKLFFFLDECVALDRCSLIIMTIDVSSLPIAATTAWVLVCVDASNCICMRSFVRLLLVAPDVVSLFLFLSLSS